MTKNRDHYTGELTHTLQGIVDATMLGYGIDIHKRNRIHQCAETITRKMFLLDEDVEKVEAILNEFFGEGEK